MAVTLKELNQFIEYIQDNDIYFGININNENQVESSLIWYSTDNTEYIFNPQTKVVLRWNGVDLNYPLELFLRDMKDLEHQYCLYENHDCYSYFEFAKEEWIKKVELYKIKHK